jgi:dTDP-4-dehydrorhamnose reductase
MRVAIVGANGQLGRQLVAAFAPSAEVIALGHDDLDLADPDSGRVLAAAAPDVVVNSAAWTDVDGCAREPERALELNGRAPGRLAAATDALFVQVSTNEVFGGSSDAPYAEADAPNPINPYGASKLAGERAVAEVAARHLVVRTAWLFGPGGRNFVTKILDVARSAADAGSPARVVDDEWGNPTWTPALAEAIVAAVALPDEGRPTILHLAGEPPVSRFAWADRVLRLRGGLPAPEPVPGSTFTRPSQVPPRAVLSTRRAADLGLPPISWESPLAGYLASLGAPA